MKTLVFEQWQGGHYFNYLECLVPKLAELSDEVVVAITATAASSEAFARKLGHLRQLSNVYFDTAATVPQVKSALDARFDMTRNLIEACGRHKPGFVFLPSADEYLLTLPLKTLTGKQGSLRGVPLEAGIHFKSYTAVANARERVLSTVQRALLNTGAFSQLHFVNSLQYEDAVIQQHSMVKMSRAAGDPVPQPPRIERGKARRALGLSTDGRLIGMIGGLDERKSVPSTLAAFRAAALPKTDRLLLAGKLIPPFSQLVQAEYTDLINDGSLIVLDRFLSEEELGHCFAALNLHCSVYNQFSGLSSLMLKSVAAGVPVLVNNRPGWTRAMAKRFGIGSQVDPDNICDFAHSLRKSLDESDGFVYTEAIRRLMKFHSIENFTEGLTARLRTLAGKRNTVPGFEWSWVLEALPPDVRYLR